MTDKYPIGGFFEFELQHGVGGYHPNALALTNGRACMSWVLKKTKPTKVYVPFYTCYALYEPMEKMGIPFEFYPIDKNMDPVSFPKLNENELFVYINFYGLKNKQIPNLIEKYKEKLVIDDTHNFFKVGYGESTSFTSARKYFGVPDGAYLYAPGTNPGEPISRYTNVSVSHNIKRMLGKQTEAYKEYLAYEESLGYDVKKISLLSEKLLSNVNYQNAILSRKANFKYLHDRLKGLNNIEIDIESMNAPFCYPFLPSKHIEKKLFYGQNIFVPTLWPDILERKTKGYEFEKKLTQYLLPLPIDQRYGINEMDRIYRIIKKLL